MATAPPGLSGSNGITIIKDPGFFRALADTVLVVAKGSETELCFVVVGPDPVLQVSADPGSSAFTPGPVQMQASLSDIGHVRIDDNAAADLMLNLAVSLVERGIINFDEVIDNINRVIDRGSEQSANADAVGGEAA